MGNDAGIAGTHIVCGVPVAGAVSCLPSGPGGPPEGTYGAGTSQTAISVSRVRGGKPTSVYTARTVSR